MGLQHKGRSDAGRIQGSSLYGGGKSIIPAALSILSIWLRFSGLPQRDFRLILTVLNLFENIFYQVWQDGI